MLILAEHEPLPPADRKRSSNTALSGPKKLDDSLAEIEAGKAVTALRAQVDETVDRLAKTLRDRASEPAPA